MVSRGYEETGVLDEGMKDAMEVWPIYAGFEFYAQA
jgi:hypothetical protein